MNGSTNGLGALGARLWRAALELLYPPRCAACDTPLSRDGDLFCGGCALTLAPIESACPRCARPSAVRLAHPPPCLGCLQRPPRFDAALAGYEFGGAIAEAIRNLKWHHMPELAAPLGELLFRALRSASPELLAIDVIVPVPLHRRRLRAREFNQAAELAAALREAARAREAPLGKVALDARALERTRDTPPQTGLDAAQRRRNVYDAFRVRAPDRVRGKRVLLVDDVMTTGATADACASALSRAGAAAVVVLTLGRAMP
ncbi:MAG TPA: ComF family protein [Polyangia bacterium]|jgi:ComF family protein